MSTTTTHIAEDKAFVGGSVIGKTNNTSTLGDLSHRFALLAISGSGVIDYETTLQFKKNDVATLKIESDGRISGVADPLYSQDVATRAYVLANAGSFNDSKLILIKSSGSLMVKQSTGDILMVR